MYVTVGVSVECCVLIDLCGLMYPHFMSARASLVNPLTGSLSSAK